MAEEGFWFTGTGFRDDCGIGVYVSGGAFDCSDDGEAGRMELWSFGRAVSMLNSWVISLTLLPFLKMSQINIQTFLTWN